MARPWVLPGLTAPCFVFLSTDKANQELYRQIPSVRAVESLSHWLGSYLGTLQDMEQELSSRCVSTENKERLRMRLSQAFLHNELLLFESRRPGSVQAYEHYVCIAKNLGTGLDSRRASASARHPDWPAHTRGVRRADQQGSTALSGRGAGLPEWGRTGRSLWL